MTDEYSDDHDLLIRIDARISQLLDSLNKANVPAACAQHAQRHAASESRLKLLESRVWWMVTTAISAGIAALCSLVLGLIEGK